MKILLIEDNKFQVELVREIFDGESYHLNCISDGLDALNYLMKTNDKPDVVLVDYHVPRMNGIEIMEKTIASGRIYGFIFITIEDSIDTAVKAMKAGALDFINKSANLKVELPIMVDKVFKLHKARIEKEESCNKLNESEMHYRNLFNHSPVAYWEEDASKLKTYIEQLKQQGISDFRTYFEEHPELIEECLEMVEITTLNNAALKLHNLKRDEIENLKLSRFFNDKTKENFKEEILSFAEGKFIFTYESPQITAEGHEILTFSIVSIVLSDSKDWSKLLCAVVDVTEHKRTEKALKESEEKYSILIKTANDAIILSDGKTGEIIEVNPMGEKLIGMSREKLIGLHHSKIHPKYNYEKYIQNFREREEKDGGEWEEIEIFAADGRTIPVAISSAITTIKGRELNLCVFHDISEIKNTQEALIESEKKFRSIYENANIGILEVSVEKRRIEKANPKLCKMFGYERGDLINKDFEVLLHPDYHIKYRKQTEMLLNGEIGSYKEERKYIHKNGKIIWGNVGVSLIKDKENNPLYFIAILEDITKRKKTHQSLIDSEKKYKYLIENQAEGVGISNLNEVIVYTNPAADKIFGVEEGQLIGKTLNSYLDKDQIEFIKKQTLNRKQKQTNTYELYVTRPDKQKKCILITATPEIDIDGNVTGTLAIFRDITERKEAEQKLKESEEIYRALIETANDAIFIANGKTGEIIIANKKACEMLKKDISQIIGLHLSKLYPRDKLREYSELFRKFAAKGSGRIDDVEIIKSDGHRVPVNISSTILAIGKNVFIFSIFHDISEIKKAGQALVKSEKQLQEANMTKDKFLSIIAHDLRGPLGSVVNVLELLNTNFDNYETEKTKKFITISYEASERCFNLLENLLDWSRSQSNRIKFNPEKINLRPLIHENIMLLKNNASRKKIQLKNNNNTDTYAFADKAMVMIIIRNLLSNAIKFTHKEGNVNISTKETDKFIEIYVKDNGVGIYETDIEKLFRIDEKITKKGTDDESGTGLGLILCKEFVEKNGGKITVESQFGEGTTFSFTLKRIL